MAASVSPPNDIRLSPNTSSAPPTTADTTRSVSPTLTKRSLCIAITVLLPTMDVARVDDARPVPSAASARDEAREEIPTRRMPELRQAPRRVERRRVVLVRQRPRKIVQRRPAVAVEQIAEQRRADRMRESRRGRSHGARGGTPRDRVDGAGARERGAREERATGEVVAGRCEPGAEADECARGGGRPRRIVRGARRRQHIRPRAARVQGKRKRRVE